MGKSLILSANAHPRRGGQGLNLYHMTMGLREAFAVRVFCEAAVDSLPTVAVPRPRSLSWLARIPGIRHFRGWHASQADAYHDRYVARRLLPAYLNGGDKVDLFQGCVGQSLESLRVARERGCRTVLDVVTAHVDQFAEAQARECARFGIPPILSERHRRRIRREYEAADLIRVMSHVAKRTFLERGFPEKRLVVAAPPIDLAEFPIAKHDEPVFRIGFAGLLEPWKGFHYLIEAYEKLGLPDTELVFWGSTGQKVLHRYVREVMARTPSISMRPVTIRDVGFAEVYGRASVFVLPSLSDGFGYVAAEAMACGVPVILTSSTGAADLVQDGINGYIVPPGDADAIRDRLHHLAKNPALVRSMGQAARAAAGALTLERFRASYAARLLALAG